MATNGYTVFKVDWYHYIHRDGQSPNGMMRSWQIHGEIFLAAGGWVHIDYHMTL